MFELSTLLLVSSARRRCPMHALRGDFFDESSGYRSRPLPAYGGPTPSPVPPSQNPGTAKTLGCVPLPSHEAPDTFRFAPRQPRLGAAREATPDTGDLSLNRTPNRGLTSVPVCMQLRPMSGRVINCYVLCVESRGPPAAGATPPGKEGPSELPSICPVYGITIPVCRISFGRGSIAPALAVSIASLRLHPRMVADLLARRLMSYLVASLP